MTSQTFEKLDRAPVRLADGVYDQLLRAIISGQIAPGERLIQEKIAEEIDVSRTPVREALLRLEQEGIIELSGRRGFVVRAITEDEIRDLYQAREAIEGFAAGVVAGRGSAAALRRIEEVLQEEAGHGQDSVEAAYEANVAVHRAVVEAAGNEVLIGLFDTVWSRNVAMRLYTDLFSEAGLVGGFAHEHTTLFEALCSGDPDRATRAMTDHIRAGLDLQVQALAARTARVTDRA